MNTYKETMASNVNFVLRKVAKILLRIYWRLLSFKTTTNSAWWFDMSVQRYYYTLCTLVNMSVKKHWSQAKQCQKLKITQPITTIYIQMIMYSLVNCFRNHELRMCGKKYSIFSQQQNSKYDAMVVIIKIMLFLAQQLNYA